MNGKGREKKKWNKLWSLLLSAALVLTLLPAAKVLSLAAAHPSAEEIIINKFDFSAAPYYKNGGQAGTSTDYNVWYNAETGVLELKDFHGTDSPIWNQSALPLTIKVTGKNTLKIAVGDTASAIGIDSYYGELSFVGDGSLSVDITGGNPMCYAIGGKRVAVGDRVTMNISVQSKADVCGIYAVEGVRIKEKAAVNITSTGTGAGYEGIAIFVDGGDDSGEIRFESESPTTIKLAGETGKFNYAVYNTVYVNQNPGALNNGNSNISFLGKGRVSVINTGKVYAAGIVSDSNLDGKPGEILLRGAEVEIRDCNDDIVNRYNKTPLNKADIIIKDNSKVTVVSDKEAGFFLTDRKGIVSAANGILIEDSGVSVTAVKGGLDVNWYYEHAANQSPYGIDIKGTSKVSLTGGENGENSYILAGNNRAVCDFDLLPGGWITIKDGSGKAADITKNVFIKTGACTKAAGEKKTQHSTDPNAFAYVNPGEALKFTGETGSADRKEPSKEADKELIKNIIDPEQARLVEKLLANGPVTEKKTALRALTAGTKAVLAAGMLPKYTDVKTGRWYSSDLAVIMALGLAKGTGAGTFSPDRNVTGQEMMAMLVRCMGKEVTPVTGNNWYAPYKSEAAALKLDEGLRFDLAKELTRAEAAQMMYRYIKLNEKTGVKPDSNALAQIKDRAEIPTEYQTAVAYMYQKGIFKGYEDGSFAPNKSVSRIEVIVLLARLLVM